MSGGGPELGRTPQDETRSQTTTCRFKRYVAPDTVRIDGLPNNTDEILYVDNKLTLKRPLLGYPSVVFTGKYDATDPIALLQAASDAELAKPPSERQAFGIADPDVDSVEITVELQTLKMDNMQSVSGRESYIKFYTTKRKFPAISAVFEDALVVPLEYRDCKVLKFGDPGDLGDLGVNQAELDALPQLILPRARTIRLTIRAGLRSQAGLLRAGSARPRVQCALRQDDPVPVACRSARGRTGAAWPHEAGARDLPATRSAIPVRRQSRQPAARQGRGEGARHGAAPGPAARRREQGSHAGGKEGPARPVRLFAAHPPHAVARQLDPHVCEQGRSHPSLAVLPRCWTWSAIGPGTDWRIAAS